MRHAAWQRRWYEVRVLGMATFAMLALVILLGVLGVIALVLLHIPGLGAAWLGAQFLAALAVGISTAALGGHDHARELHLTLPTAYQRTLRWRCAMLGSWTAVLGVAASCGLVSAGVPVMPMSHAALALLWLALFLQGVLPLICFGDVGFSATLLLQSSTGGATFVMGLWLALLLLAIGASLSWHSWLLCYLTLLLISGIAMLHSQLQLHHTDRLLWGAMGE